jgi:hypothetical protein
MIQSSLEPCMAELKAVSCSKPHPDALGYVTHHANQLGAAFHWKASSIGIANGIVLGCVGLRSQRVTRREREGLKCGWNLASSLLEVLVISWEFL